MDETKLFLHAFDFAILLWQFISYHTINTITSQVKYLQKCSINKLTRNSQGNLESSWSCGLHFFSFERSMLVPNFIVLKLPFEEFLSVLSDDFLLELPAPDGVPLFASSS